MAKFYNITSINDNIDTYSSLNKYKVKLMLDRRRKYYEIEDLFAKKIINAIFIISFVLMIILGITSNINNMLFLLICYWICTIVFSTIIKITEQVLKPF